MKKYDKMEIQDIKYRLATQYENGFYNRHNGFNEGQAIVDIKFLLALAETNAKMPLTESDVVELAKRELTLA